MNKILAGLATLQGAITVKLNNLAAMEINAGEAEGVAAHLWAERAALHASKCQCAAVLDVTG